MSSFFQLSWSSSTTTITKKEIIHCQSKSNDYCIHQYVSAHHSDKNQIRNKYCIPQFHDLYSKLFVCERCWQTIITFHFWIGLHYHPSSISYLFLNLVFTFVRTHGSHVRFDVPQMTDFVFCLMIKSVITINTFFPEERGD